MARVKVDWRSASRENYNDFLKKNPTIKLTYVQWQNIIYTYTDLVKTYILETGDKARLPNGFGVFSINKKKRKRIVNVKGEDHVNLSIDWKKTKEKGKVIYNFNHHTEGYFFGWMWFRNTVRLRNSEMWYFKPSRVTSRLLSHYLKTDKMYQYVYKEWKI
jgi:nucleoid DNA-binding protein